MDPAPGAGAGVKEDRAGGDDAVRRRRPWLVDAVVEGPDVLTNDVLAVRLTAGSDALAGEATVHGDTVRVSPHGFALLTTGE